MMENTIDGLFDNKEIQLGIKRLRNLFCSGKEGADTIINFSGKKTDYGILVGVEVYGRSSQDPILKSQVMKNFPQQYEGMDVMFQFTSLSKVGEE